MTKIESIKEYLLDNVDELRQIVSEINSWDSGLESLDVHENDEEFFNIFFEGKPMEAVRASFYGDYRYMDEYVRFNGYGNLESLDEYAYEREMKDYIDEIVDQLIDKKDNIDIPSDIAEFLEDDDEENLA